MTTVVEEKFDRFANDFYLFLSLRYNLKPDCKVKVVHCRNNNWKRAIPTKIRQATENNPQFQHISLAFQSNTGKLCAEDKKRGLVAAGFTPEQSETFSHYDALLYVNFDEPVRMKTGEPYIWNLLLSHHVLHIVEILTDQRIINEPPTKHNYESPEALEHFNRFVGWIGGLDEMIDRYVPCR